MPRTSFAKPVIEALPFPPRGPEGEVRQVDYYDETDPGLCLRVSSTGVRTWFLVTRLNGEVRRFTIGRYPKEKGAPGVLLRDARDRALEFSRMVAIGRDPTAEAKAAEQNKAEDDRQAEIASGKFLYTNVLADYVEIYCKVETRGWHDTQRNLNKYTVPAWGERAIHSIRRAEVTELLNNIQRDSGRATANHVLALVRHFFNWYTTCDETFVSPIVKGMRRGKPTRRKRKLTDDELKRVWNALGDHTFDRIVRLLFLTLQRREEVGQMKWVDLNPVADGGPLWSIPDEVYKTKIEQTVPLTPEAWAIIDAQPRIEGCPFVFTTNGRTHFQGHSKKKTALALAHGEMPPWVLHDIRRTMRSLMPRASVHKDIAERVIGHAEKAIVDTYDQYEYVPEKRAALESVTALFMRIVS